MRDVPTPIVLGALSLLGSALSAELALAHMRSISALGPICGTGPDPCCGWCPLALTLLAAGLGLLAAGVRRPARAAAFLTPRNEASRRGA